MPLIQRPFGSTGFKFMCVRLLAFVTFELRIEASRGHGLPESGVLCTELALGHSCDNGHAVPERWRWVRSGSPLSCNNDDGFNIAWSHVQEVGSSLRNEIKHVLVAQLWREQRDPHSLVK